MGIGHPPGSTGRRPGGQSDDRAADAAQYGRGTQDPVTGLYEWYEFPEDFNPQGAGEGEGLTVVAVLEQWPLIMADFASEFGIRLHTETDQTLTWAAFYAYLGGLFTADTRLSRHFAKDPEPDGGQL